MGRQKSYYELLKHPKWQKKRLEILNEHNFECEDCGADDKSLQIHHSYYEKGLLPWEYPNESLHCLCEDCHRQAQDWLTLLHRQIGRLELGQIEDLLGYAMAIEAGNYPMITFEVHSYGVAEGVADAYHLKAEEVIDALNEGQIDGYKLDAMQHIKHGGRDWLCGICGTSASRLFLDQTRGDDNPYQSLQEHAINDHGLDRQAVEESYHSRRLDGRAVVDGQVWMRLSD